MTDLEFNKLEKYYNSIRDKRNEILALRHKIKELHELIEKGEQLCIFYRNKDNVFLPSSAYSMDCCHIVMELSYDDVIVIIQRLNEKLNVLEHDFEIIKYQKLE